MLDDNLNIQISPRKKALFSRSLHEQKFSNATFRGENSARFRVSSRRPFVFSARFRADTPRKLGVILENINSFVVVFFFLFFFVCLFVFVLFCFVFFFFLFFFCCCCFLLLLFLLLCLICGWFYVQVNNYGHAETVS